MFLSAIKRSGLHYQGCHDILYLWGGLLQKSGIFVNMCLLELQVPPGSALSFCSVHAAFDRKEPCIFNHAAYVTATCLWPTCTVTLNFCRDESDQSGLDGLSLHISCLSVLIATPRDPQSKGKQWGVQISEVYPNQWAFSILLMRHVFHHILWKVLSLFSWGLKNLRRRQEVVTATQAASSSRL